MPSEGALPAAAIATTTGDSAGWSQASAPLPRRQCSGGLASALRVTIKGVMGHTRTVERGCTARKRNGELCRNQPMRGRAVCKAHAGDENLGRPSKFTPETRKRITQGLAAGLTCKDAALHAGISKETLKAWIGRGHEQQEDGPAGGDYAHFLREIEEAEARYKVRALGLISAAMPKDWKAAAWVLERKFPHEWGKRDAKLIEHTEPDDLGVLLGGRQPVSVSPDTRMKICDLLDRDDKQKARDRASG